MKWTIALLFAATAFGGECVKVKAAFDIGSGTTKMKVAKVDTCLQKIEKILLEANEPVAYKEKLQNNKDNKLDAAILDEGLKALLKLKKKAQQYAPELYAAAATSAFRTAVNGSEAAQKLSEESGIKIYVISQKKEALLGFAAAAAKAQKDLTDILVWDIGGGSMQMTSYIGNNKFDIYEGKIASASFKKFVIEAVQNKDPKKVDSPNPISKEDSNAAIKEASKMADTKVPKSIKDKIKSKADVIGIGGVHYYSVRGQAGVEQSYNSKSLEETILKKIGKSNKEIGGDYASTDVSNLLLVKGYMDGLGIKEVHAFKINLADGMLIGEQLLSK